MDRSQTIRAPASYVFGRLWAKCILISDCTVWLRIPPTAVASDPPCPSYLPLSIPACMGWDFWNTPYLPVVCVRAHMNLSKFTEVHVDYTIVHVCKCLVRLGSDFKGWVYPKRSHLLTLMLLQISKMYFVEHKKWNIFIHCLLLDAHIIKLWIVRQIHHKVSCTISKMCLSYNMNVWQADQK